MSIQLINNGENASSIRNKLNQIINKTNNPTISYQALTGSYPIFLDNTTGDFLDIAFGKNVEEYMTGLGVALGLYGGVNSSYLDSCNNLEDINNNQNALMAFNETLYNKVEKSQYAKDTLSNIITSGDNIIYSYISPTDNYTTQNTGDIFIKKNGVYNIKVYLYNQYVYLYIYVNGVNVVTKKQDSGTRDISNTILYLNAGDIVKIQTGGASESDYHKFIATIGVYNQLSLPSIDYGTSINKMILQGSHSTYTAPVVNKYELNNTNKFSIILAGYAVNITGGNTNAYVELVSSDGTVKETHSLKNINNRIMYAKADIGNTATIENGDYLNLYTQSSASEKYIYYNFWIAYSEFGELASTVV